MTDITPVDVVVKTRPSRFGIFLALLLSLAALVAVGYLYYQGRLVQNILYEKIANLDSSISIMQRVDAQKMQEQERAITVLTSQLDQLTANKTNILLFQVNELLSSANQSLLVYHDVRGAIHLLGNAQDLLLGNNQAVFTNLKLALATDLTRLQQLSIIDNVELSGTLDGLGVQVKSLQSTTFESLPAPTQMYSSESQTKWMKFFADVKHKLYGLVRISRANTNKELAMDANAEGMVKQNIRVDLLNAKMALLLRDNKTWQYSLSNAITLSRNYFSGASSLNLQHQLEELTKVNIDDSGANMDDTLKALNELNNF